MDPLTLGISLLFTLLVSLGLALISTPLAMDLALRLGVIDKPSNPRKVHTKPVPYLGGVAIYVSFLVATVIFTEMTPEILAMLAGGFVLMVVGALDDYYDLSPRLRLLVQFLCAWLAVASGIRIIGIGIPFSNDFLHLGPLSWPLTILWIMAITNVMNFIDGLDGLTAGTTVIVCLTLIFVAWGSADQALYNYSAVILLCVAMIGASLGFLRYNSYPARIFMGDAGACFIGYVLGCLSVVGPMKQATLMTMITPALALGLPLFDTAVVMFRRIRAGKSPMQADRTHAHHRLFDSGLSQKQTVYWLYAISACFGLAAVSINTPHGRLVALITGVVGTGLFVYAHRLESKRIDERPTRDLTGAVRLYQESLQTKVEEETSQEQGEAGRGKDVPK
ncbi:MAG: undecaprenyl/decaprenyl-phosphate alpha-N-acetylglucosaminyl 1-phosphate transferase [Symbiobacteriaceae bacterium]|nr:undecaprenyl/decaprenyl-phosphate alpha-N-acetylglucosaminyl 1-phosphate transferase [Symbiobacteriaceae bacterium]